MYGLSQPSFIGIAICIISAWDPYLFKDIMAIEKVQRCAARWVTSNYDWRNGISTTSTLADLLMAQSFST